MPYSQRIVLASIFGLATDCYDDPFAGLPGDESPFMGLPGDEDDQEFEEYVLAEGSEDAPPRLLRC